MRYMSNGKLSVPMVLRCPVGTANRGAQHGQCPESYFVHVPGLKVVCVSDAYHAKGLLKSAVRDDDPVLFFEHKLLYGSKGREQAGGMDLTAHVPEEEYLFPIGKAVVKREGTSVTVVATHMSLYRSLAAAEELAAGRHRLRGDRSPDAAAVRRGDDLRVGEEDRPAGDCPRGHADRRMGRRACGAESPRSASTRCKRRSGEWPATTFRCRSHPSWSRPWCRRQARIKAAIQRCCEG